MDRPNISRQSKYCQIGQEAISGSGPELVATAPLSTWIKAPTVLSMYCIYTVITVTVCRSRRPRQYTTANRNPCFRDWKPCNNPRVHKAHFHSEFWWQEAAMEIRWIQQILPSTTFQAGGWWPTASPISQDLLLIITEFARVLLWRNLAKHHRVLSRVSNALLWSGSFLSLEYDKNHASVLWHVPMHVWHLQELSTSSSTVFFCGEDCYKSVAHSDKHLVANLLHSQLDCSHRLFGTIQRLLPTFVTVFVILKSILTKVLMHIVMYSVVPSTWILWGRVRLARTTWLLSSLLMECRSTKINNQMQCLESSKFSTFHLSFLIRSTLYCLRVWLGVLIHPNI